MDSYLLGPIAQNGTLRAVPLSTGGLAARQGRRAKAMTPGDAPDVLPNRGPALTADLCALAFVEFGQPVQRVQVGKMTGEQVEMFLEEKLNQMYDVPEAVTTKFRYLVNDGIWDKWSKWWALSELERFVKGKMWQGKPIRVFVA